MGLVLAADRSGFEDVSRLMRVASNGYVERSGCLPSLTPGPNLF